MTPTKTFGANAFGPGVATHSLGKPAAAFPGRVATDSDLIIAVDRQQTRLAQPLNASDTSMTVTDASAIVSYNLLSIDNEIVKTTGPPVGNVIPIARGFDGTTPALHLASATVSGFIDAYHHNGLVAEIEAIEQALGANLSHLPTSPFVISGAFNFAAQSPGGSLIAGANNITLMPVPPGVSGTDTGHSLYISGGTGAAEAGLIIGGSAVAGAPSGTLIVQCANAHTGAWTIQSATAGIQEAVCSLPAGGGEVIVNLSGALQSNVTAGGKAFVQLVKLAGITLTGAFTLLGQNSSADARTETFSYVSPNNTFGTTGHVITGASPTALDMNKPVYAVLEANGNNYPIKGLNPIQFSGVGLLGAYNVPASALTGGGSGVHGVCTTSSTNCCAVGLTGYANTLVDGCRAWAANFTVSNQTAPSGTTGVHAVSIIGLEIDLNIFGPGNCDGVTGLQIIGLSSNIQPPSANGIQIAPLGNGSPGQPKWTVGLQCYVGASKIAIEIQQKETGVNQDSQAIQFDSTDPAGHLHASSMNLQATGTFVISGGNNQGSPAGGVALIDGDGNYLANFQPGSISLHPLPVFANNAAALAGGLVATQLYKTSTGQVMQVF